jgi:hypothetical protein
MSTSALSTVPKFKVYCLAQCNAALFAVEFPAFWGNLLLCPTLTLAANASLGKLLNFKQSTRRPNPEYLILPCHYLQDLKTALFLSNISCVEYRIKVLGTIRTEKSAY